MKDNISRNEIKTNINFYGYKLISNIESLFDNSMLLLIKDHILEN